MELGLDALVETFEQGGLSTLGAPVKVGDEIVVVGIRSTGESVTFRFPGDTATDAVLRSVLDALD